VVRREGGQSALPYGERARTRQIDMMAYDEPDRTIRAYEIKRGNGQFDAGKIRSIKRDLMCVQVLLKSYGQTANVNSNAAEAKIIFYYYFAEREWQSYTTVSDAFLFSTKISLRDVAVLTRNQNRPNAFDDNAFDDIKMVHRSQGLTEMEA